MLHDDALDDGGDVLALVERVLDVIVNLLPLHRVDGVGPLEELGQGQPAILVPDVLEAVNLDAVIEDAPGVIQIPQAVHGLLDNGGGVGKHFDQMNHLVAGVSRFVQEHAVRGGLDAVQDVVEAPGQVVDVLMIEGGDEGAIEAVGDLVGGDLTLVLDLLDLTAEGSPQSG